MTLTDRQVTQLLQPINPSRVLADGKGHAHVSQQDILAHLIRVFGFGNFDTEVLSLEPIFEQPAAKNAQRFDVCYRALVRLTIRDPEGQTVAHYENGSTATAQNQTRGDAHDLAMKSAISLAVKRAAIALGDQFGLSLYNKGQRDALVRGTIVGSPEGDAKHEDVQVGVPQQVAMGNDETDVPLDHDAGEVYKPPPGTRNTSETGELITAKQLAMLNALASKLGLDRAAKIAGASHYAGRPVESTKYLSKAEAGRVIDAMQAKADALDSLGAQEIQTNNSGSTS